MGAAQVVQTFQLVVDGDQLATDVIGVLKPSEVEQHGLDLGLAVNQQTALAGSGFVAHREVRRINVTLPSKGGWPGAVVKFDAVLGPLGTVRGESLQLIPGYGQATWVSSAGIVIIRRPAGLAEPSYFLFC